MCDLCAQCKRRKERSCAPLTHTKGRGRKGGKGGKRGGERKGREREVAHRRSARASASARHTAGAQTGDERWQQIMRGGGKLGKPTHLRRMMGRSATCFFLLRDMKAVLSACTAQVRQRRTQRHVWHTCQRRQVATMMPSSLECRRCWQVTCRSTKGGVRRWRGRADLAKCYSRYTSAESAQVSTSNQIYFIHKHKISTNSKTPPYTRCGW